MMQIAVTKTRNNTKSPFDLYTHVQEGRLSFCRIGLYGLLHVHQRVLQLAKVLKFYDASSSSFLT
jgi:hypothetical protein